jgi:hypothetical protein
VRASRPFQGETFDPKTLDAHDCVWAMARHFTAFGLSLLETVMPVLTPAQREALVAKLQHP